MQELQKTVVMVGMMGAGKTAVGGAVARSLGAPFLDSDVEIERAANCTIAEIFARDGEAFFRAKESQVLRRLLEGRPAVLSTGGGAWLASRNREMVARMGVSVWLRATHDLLWARVRHKNTRPLLRTADPEGTLRRLAAEREPAYRLADVVVDADAALSVEQMAARVIAALTARTGILSRRAVS